MTMMITSTFCGFIAVLFLLISNVQSSTFTVRNHCPHTIWPGTLAGAGTPELPTTGFQLESRHSVKIVASPGWSGRIWARTGCVFDGLGVGTCQTGDCGGRMECNGIGAAPPATLFEVSLGKGEDKDYYDVSVVDGYNLPVGAIAHGVNEGCNATGCAANLNAGCPKELQVVDTAIASAREDHVVGCKSACEAFGTDEYCCSGEYANPNTCKPSFYSVIFKKACPKAYSYAFDDGTSTFTCKAIDYTITFCPSTIGLRRPNVSSTPPPPIHGQSNGENWGIITPSISNEQSTSSSIPLHITVLVILLILFS